LLIEVKLELINIAASQSAAVAQRLLGLHLDTLLIDQNHSKNENT